MSADPPAPRPRSPWHSVHPSDTGRLAATAARPGSHAPLPPRRPCRGLPYDWHRSQPPADSKAADFDAYDLYAGNDAASSSLGSRAGGGEGDGEGSTPTARRGGFRSALASARQESGDPRGVGRDAGAGSTAPGGTRASRPGPGR